MALTSTADPTYPPLDTLKAVANNVWIVASGPIRIIGMTAAPRPICA